MARNLREHALELLKQKKGLNAYNELKKMPLSTERVGKAFVTSLTKK